MNTPRQPVSEATVSAAVETSAETTAETIIAAHGLNDRQRLFVAEYLVDRNATRAYIRAGYSPDGARQSASRLHDKC